MIELKIQGLDALNKKLSGITKEASIDIRKAVNAGALMVRTTAKALIRKPSYGRVYGGKVSFRRVTRRQERAGRTRGTARSQKIHIASKPGDAPNTDTGNLIRNIRVSSGKGTARRGYYATVKVTTPYAMRMEYGGSHIAGNGRTIQNRPRPFMRPALAANKDKIEDMVMAAIRKAFN